MRVWRSSAAVLGVALLTILGVAEPAGAQGLQLGPFRLLPTLGLSLEYDDNILLTPDDELADFIWHITPGVVVELPLIASFSGESNVTRLSGSQSPRL